MLRLIVSLISILLITTCSTKVSHAQEESEIAAGHLTELLSNASNVSLFFVSRTGSYDFSTEDIKKHSSVTNHRKCEESCSDVLSSVVIHLRDAKPAECVPGQQNILLKIDNDAQITYSYSGRMIEFNGRCFYNEIKLRDLLRSDNLISR